jgi:predicted nucleic acid-binding protein
MIVLDTNIISEPSKLRPDPMVLAWLNRTPKHLQFLTVLTVAELSAGGHRTFIKSGSRKYLDTLANILDSEFPGRLLPFDTAASSVFGRIFAERESVGRQMSQMDAMIAAICLVHGATLATRDIRDFDGLDLKLVNPFEAAA